MENKQKVVIFAVLAAISAATTAIIVSHPSVRPISIIIPMIFMAVFLFFAGYFAGLDRKER